MFSYPPEIQTLLRSMYAEEGRTYHGMNHIKYLLSKAHEWFQSSTSNDYNVFQLVRHAIWWHDAWYSIFDTPGMNEVNSAGIFTSLHNEGKFTLDVSGMSEDDAAEIVHAAILTTARHLEDIDFDTEWNWHRRPTDILVAKVMMDVDLVGFAESLDMVKYHSELVVKEYTAMQKPREDVLKGRINFLKQLLKRKRIFYTDYFHQKYEFKARHNLIDSIDAAQEELDAITQAIVDTTLVNAIVDDGYHEQGLKEWRKSKRFTNHAGLKGFVSSHGISQWYLAFDDGSNWVVDNIDNLSIKD